MIRTTPEIGFQLPGYALLREIGRGGVSTVYLARHELLGREVAIKVMSPVLAVEEGFNKRFIREGQTVSRLKHPGIVTVYDVAVVDHRPFIAMEYLPGGSLKDRLTGPLAPEEAIAYLRTIADSLGYAHSRGVFHRDVKPENILFRENGDSVLTDFGIAKSDTQDTALTSIGVVVGTPRYISPEQAQGEASDARSDIYALGVMLHEMLTGRPPYDVKGSMSLLYAHINEPIPRLPNELARFQELIDDLLAKDPAQRISDCALLVKRLDEPMPYRRVARRRRRNAVQVRSGRSRRLTRSAGALAAVLVPAVVLVLWMQGYLIGSGWGPESGEEFKNTVSRLVTPGSDASGRQARGVEANGDASSDGDGSRDTALDSGESGVVAPDDGGSADMVSEGDTTDSAEQFTGSAAGETRRGVSARRNEYPTRYRAVQPDPAPTPPTAWTLSESSGAQSIAEPSRGLDAESIYKQAQAVLTGRVAEENLVAAAELHEQAANKGHALSQYYLGVAYGNGDGVEHNEPRALRWLRRAADAGVRGAQYNLILARIFGANPDAGAAARAALDLAEKKYTPVYRILGWMYNTGTGVDSSFAQSVRWNVKTMVGDVTGQAGPRWVVRRWERRLQAELAKIRETKPPRVKSVVK